MPNLVRIIFVACVMIFSSGSFSQDSLRFSLEDWVQLQPDSVIDVDGNVYHILKLGNQYWLKENLYVTKFNNGEPIANLEDNNLWVKAEQPAYTDIYGFTEGNVKIGGHHVVYNGYVVNDEANVCPGGWHVPSTSDWTLFLVYLDSLNKAWNKDFPGAGGVYPPDYGDDSTKMLSLSEQIKIQEDLWNQPYLFFTGYLPGRRTATTGEIYSYNSFAFWWSGDSLIHYSSWYGVFDRHFALEWIYQEDPLNINTGLSIRCIKD